MSETRPAANVSDNPSRENTSRPGTASLYDPLNLGNHLGFRQLRGLNQQQFEKFILLDGNSYRSFSFYCCNLIQDFSPLEDLPLLESVSIYWNTRSDKLWNFSKTPCLKYLDITDAKRITLNPDQLKTSPALEDVSFTGIAFGVYPMESLSVFKGMPKLKRLMLRRIRLLDHSLSTLGTLPCLERFDFDAGMLTTEEIAWIVAKYPHFSGKSLCAYNKDDAVLNDVRVCGYRKPGLNLPDQQKRLDKYIAQFNALVEKYRNEL